MTLDISPEHARDFVEMFLTRGDLVALARLHVERQDYGQQAKILRQSGFFRNPQVWKIAGSDADYQEWCRNRPCAVDKKQTWIPDKGIFRCEYAHVRHGSGVGIKPEYSGIPMCHECHRYQHQHGETALLRKHGITEGREWYDRQVVQHLEQWAWETIRERLGYNHWSQIPPEVAREWAEEHNLEMPNDYR